VRDGDPPVQQRGFGWVPAVLLLAALIAVGLVVVWR
jgi:hypothetical protein